jgi:hypothetical protein
MIMALAAGSLMAQEGPRVDARIQLFVEMSRPAQIVVAQNPGDVKDQPGSQTGVGFRFLGEIASLPNWYYELGGMFDAFSKFSLNNGSANLTDVKVTDSYWSVGAAYLWKVGESNSFGLHLEGRGEYLRLQGEAIVGTTDVQTDSSTTYLRPWVRASFDHTFTGVGAEIHPFIGLDGSLALLRTSQTRVPDFTSADDRTVRALAPRYSAAIYGGLRF